MVQRESLLHFARLVDSTCCIDVEFCGYGSVFIQSAREHRKLRYPVIRSKFVTMAASFFPVYVSTSRVCPNSATCASSADPVFAFQNNAAAVTRRQRLREPYWDREFLKAELSVLLFAVTPQEDQKVRYQGPLL